MSLKNIVVTILILIVVTSCGLKQPDDSILDLLLGSAYVNSNLTDAKIFVDYDSTGKVTPDSIHSLPVGTHVIHVFKDGYFSLPDSIVFIAEYPKTYNANFLLQQISNPGIVYINSVPSGAKIWIDSSFSGKTTPAHVTVTAGLKQITLRKNGFEIFRDNINVTENDTVPLDANLAVLGAQILIESFANSSCLPCTTTNSHIEIFIVTNKTKHYALIEYFTSWPNPLDPMYQHNTAGASARFSRDFYSIFTVPSMLIDGISVNALDYSSIQNTFDSHLSSATPDVSISLSEQISDSLRVTVELNEINTLPAGDWRLFIAVIEQHVSFSQPPGSNGLSNFSHVFRKFVTVNEGDTFNFTNNNFTKSYTSSVSPEWDLSEIQIIGFVQDINTKVVINSSHL